MYKIFFSGFAGPPLSRRGFITRRMVPRFFTFYYHHYKMLHFFSRFQSRLSHSLCGALKLRLQCFRYMAYLIFGNIKNICLNSHLRFHHSNQKQLGSKLKFFWFEYARKTDLFERLNTQFILFNQFFSCPDAFQKKSHSKKIWKRTENSWSKLQFFWVEYARKNDLFER